MLLAALELLSSASSLQACTDGLCASREQTSTPIVPQTFVSATHDLGPQRTTASTGVFSGYPSSWVSQGESRLLQADASGQPASFSSSVQAHYRIVPGFGSQAGDGVIFVLSAGMRMQAWGSAAEPADPSDPWQHATVGASGSLTAAYTLSTGASQQYASPQLSATSTLPSPGPVETLWSHDEVGLPAHVGDEVDFTFAGVWNAVFGGTPASFPSGPNAGDAANRAAGFHGVTLTVSRPADLRALSLEWDAGGNVQYAFEYARGDMVPLPPEVKIAFYWSSGPAWQDRIGGPAFEQMVSTQLAPGAWVDAHAASLNPALLAARPVGASHLLLVLDPDDDLFEWKEGNNLLAAPAPVLAGCHVPPLSRTDAQVPAPDSAHLTPQLLAAIQSLQNLVLAEPGNPTFAVGLGHVPPALEEHLLEIRERFRALAALEGIEAFILEGGDPASSRDDRPQLRLTANPPAAALDCLPRIDQINAAVQNYAMPPDAFGAPAANPPGASLHSHSPAEAVDLVIAGVDDRRLDTLADQAGLVRPYRNDPAHFQHKTDAARQLAAVVRADAPIHLLLQDPSGRRIGFDAATQQPVNDLGPFAEYAAGGQSSLIHVPLGELLAGSYVLSGQAAAAGPYRIVVEIYGDDPHTRLFEMVVASGVGAEGSALPAIRPIDLKGAAAAPWRNPLEPLDINADGLITPLDALLIINSLNLDGARPVPYAATRTSFLDPTGDNLVVPLDALVVINRLNAIASGQGEGEALDAANVQLAAAWEATDLLAGQRDGFQSNLQTTRLARPTVPQPSDFDAALTAILAQRHPHSPPPPWWTEQGHGWNAEEHGGEEASADAVE